MRWNFFPFRWRIASGSICLRSSFTVFLKVISKAVERNLHKFQTYSDARILNSWRRFLRTASIPRWGNFFLIFKTCSLMDSGVCFCCLVLFNPNCFRKRLTEITLCMDSVCSGHCLTIKLTSSHIVLCHNATSSALQFLCLASRDQNTLRTVLGSPPKELARDFSYLLSY